MKPYRQLFKEKGRKLVFAKFVMKETFWLVSFQVTLFFFIVKGEILKKIAIILIMILIVYLLAWPYYLTLLLYRMKLRSDFDGKLSEMNLDEFHEFLEQEV